jgi:hypothetical protein
MRKLLAFSVLCVGLAACGDDSSSSSPGPDSGTADGGSGVGCGGLKGNPCAGDEYCDYADNTCGVADGTGSCKKRPDACPAVVGPPVCGCDGKIHSGECETYMTGLDLNVNGCTVPKEDLACGYAVCDLDTQYCLHDAKNADAPYRCVGLPAACASREACSCLAAEPCGNACAGDAASGLTLTCS